MEPTTLGIVLFVALLALVAWGMRIAYAAALLGFIGVWVLSGWTGVVGMAGNTPFIQARTYAITVIPLFILMGHFAFHGGITGELFRAARGWVGHISGGLPMATALGCAGFAACSGSTVASAALMSKIALPEMLKTGTQTRLAAGVVAASGTLASLIPPSVMIVIYGLISGESIGRLLIAGFIPGIVSVLIYMSMIYTRCRINPALSPRQPPFPWKTRLAYTGKGIWGMLTIFILIIGGMYFGIFTPTEAGSMGALGALVITLGRRQMTWGKLKNSLLETSETTIMVFMLIIGLNVLNYSLALSGFTAMFADFILGLGVSRYVVLIGLLVVYVLLGMFIGAMGMMLLTVPIFLPVVVSLGFDPLWFGIIVIKMVEVAVITPPIGINVFVVHGVAKDIPSWEIFKGVVPFLAMDFLTVASFIVFPQIITWLPGTMH